ncbi:MAG: hypothetical protein RMJ97_00330 [Raineya sp.]|nr:hypothetical protein [Raineya sp.]MDW8295307.1 hypothetical protein [Raineya sp.]
MYKKFYLLVMLVCIAFGSVLGQYQTKKVKIKDGDQEGTADVCINCKIKPEPTKTYYWVKAGKVGNSKGSFQGELLHGSLEIYTMGMEGKEMVERGNYFTGLKDGKVENYILGGILETIETFDKGDLKEVEFYHPETKVLDHKYVFLSDANKFPRKVKIFFYYIADHLDDNKKPTGKKFGRRLEIEGFQQINPLTSSFSNFYDGAYKRFHVWEDKETLIEEGTYSKNNKVGEWKKYYADGIVAITTYNNDLIVSEKFLKDGQPFTGVVKEMNLSGKSEIALIEVKNGVREGKTQDNFRENDKKEWKPTRTIEYVNGKAKDEAFDFPTFLSKQKIVKEVKYTMECDSKGSGLLYLDKIQYTDKGAIAYFQTVNTTFVRGSAIRTDGPGGKAAFNAYDLATKKIYPVTKVFNIALSPYSQSSAYGEMHTFMLYFEGLTDVVKKISFIEGDPENPFVIDEKTGNTTYHWGCYELTTK